jgi:hypothetical protein
MAVNVADYNPIDATSGPQTFLLPTGVAPGTVLSVEKIDSSPNVVTIVGSIRAVEAEAQPVLSKQYEVREYVADTSSLWRPIGKTRGYLPRPAQHGASQKLASWAPYTYDIREFATDAQPIVNANGSVADIGPAITAFIARWPRRRSPAAVPPRRHLQRPAVRHGRAALGQLRRAVGRQARPGRRVDGRHHHPVRRRVDAVLSRLRRRDPVRHRVRQHDDRLLRADERLLHDAAQGDVHAGHPAAARPRHPVRRLVGDVARLRRAGRLPDPRPDHREPGPRNRRPRAQPRVRLGRVGHRRRHRQVPVRAGHHPRRHRPRRRPLRPVLREAVGLLVLLPRPRRPRRQEHRLLGRSARCRL